MGRFLGILLLLGFLAWAQEERTIWDLWVGDGLMYLATGEGVRVLDPSLKEVGFLGGFPAYAWPAPANGFSPPAIMGFLSFPWAVPLRCKRV